MIRITKQTDYGIVLLTHMIGQEEHRFSAGELAEETRLPAPMVSKILKILAREGLLDSHRGVKGGYSLRRSAEEISVAEVISAIEGPIGITECIDDAAGECGFASFCGLRSNWNQINNAIRETLEKITLAEMTPPPTQDRPAPTQPTQAQLVSLGQGVALEAQ
jgi:FeS assembly SUF system regulator